MVTAPAHVDDTPDPQPRSVRRSRRIAGATRIAGLLAVIAVIAGTSIGLATADPKRTSEERTARTVTQPDAEALFGPPVVATQSAVKPEAVVTKQAVTKPVTPKPVVTKQAVEKIPVVKQATEVQPIARAQAATPAVAPAATDAPTQASSAAPAASPTAELPFTGAADVVLMRLLLAGATVALFGMLLQIAGTPLPAHAMERKRLDSRAT